MTIAGGNNQSTLINTAFAEPFSVSLTSAYSEPVDGGMVFFSAPEGGPSVTFAQPYPFSLIENGTATMSSGVYSLTAMQSFFNPLTGVAFNLTNLLTPSSNTMTSSPNPSIYGETFTVTSTVSPSTATGEVVYYVNGLYYSTEPLGPNATLTSSTNLLPPGVYTITAYYSGSATLEGSASSVYTHTVLKIGTSTAVTSSPNPSEINDNVTFTATVDQDSLITALGEIDIQLNNPFIANVEFYDDTILLGSAPIDANGVATYTASGFVVGEHPITALYVGNSYYSSSATGVYTQTVTKHATETVLEVAPNPVTVGEQVSFTATVSSGFALDSIHIETISGPTGNVSFYVDGQFKGVGTIGANGVAIYTTEVFMPAGTYTVTAEYDGAKYYSTSASNAVALVLNKIGTRVELTSDLNPSEVDQSVLFTATVAPDSLLIASLGEIGIQGGNPFNGSVEFYDGITLLGSNPIDEDGVATFTTANLAIGDRSITASYVGNDYFATSTSSVYTQTITQHATESVLEIGPNPVTFGEPLSFTTTVSSDYLLTSVGVQEAVNPLEGNVTYYVNGQQSDTIPVDENGVAADFGYAYTPAGSYSITAVYGGNAHFATSTSNEVVLVVNKAPTTVSVVSSPNPTLYGKRVTFTATVGGNVNLTSMAMMGENVNAQGGGGFLSGDVTFTASVDGDLSFESLGVDIATVNPLSGNVTFKNGADTLGVGTLDGDGIATFSTSDLPVGTHNITAVYEGNETFDGSTSNTLSQVVTGAEEPPVAPVAVNDAAGTLEGVAVSVAVLGNDLNHSNGTLSIQSITQPSHGSAAINGNDVAYTPAAGFSGLDNFTYTVVDGNSLTDVGTVAIVVSAQAVSGQAPQVAIIDNDQGGEVAYNGGDAAIDLQVPSGI